MQLESLEELKAFVQVMDSGSFTAAAEVLGSTTTLVSRLIARLETRLKTRLLTRTTRRVASTEEGRVFYAHATRLLCAAEEAEQALRASSAALEGTVRIAVRTTTVQYGFVNELTALLQAHSALRAQLIVSDSELDLAAEGIDVALRVGDLPDSSYRSHRLGDVTFVLAASPLYVDKHPRPNRPEDLVHHECVRALQHPPQTHWVLKGPKGRTVEAAIDGRFECADVRAQADAIYAGLGIGLRPAGEVRAAVANKTLAHVLPAWSLAPLSVHALLSPQRSQSARIAAVVALLKAGVKRLA